MWTLHHMVWQEVTKAMLMAVHAINTTSTVIEPCCHYTTMDG